jgi:hypothetical protein
MSYRYIQHCDIKDCRAEIPEGMEETIEIGDKEYDLCPSCFKKLNKWVEEVLEPGRPVETDQPSIIGTVDRSISPGLPISIDMNGARWVADITNTSDSVHIVDGIRTEWNVPLVSGWGY